MKNKLMFKESNFWCLEIENFNSDSMFIFQLQLPSKYWNSIHVTHIQCLLFERELQTYQ